MANGNMSSVPNNALIHYAHCVVYEGYFWTHNWSLIVPLICYMITAVTVECMKCPTLVFFRYLSASSGYFKCTFFTGIFSVQLSTHTINTRHRIVNKYVNWDTTMVYVTLSTHY